jgi:hypothetical protein
MWIALTKLRQLFACIFASIDIEASHVSIAYHAAERDGKLRFIRSRSLRRQY